MKIGIGQPVFLGLILLAAIAVQPVLGGAMEEGKAAASQGDYAAAIAHWSSLVTVPDHPQRLEALIRSGEAYRALGHLWDAQVNLEEARTVAEETGRPVLQAVATQALGHMHFLQRGLATAEQLLRTSLAQARRLQRPALAAASANSLGSVFASQRRTDEAKSLYRQALAFARQAGDPGLVAAARRNLAALLHGAEAAAQLQAAREAATDVTSPYEQADLLLGIALEADDSVLRYQALREAQRIAEAIDAARLRSLAAGHLAAFYENRGRLAAARALTEQALQWAQPLDAHELLLRWEGQRGRLMRAQGDPGAAIEAYRRAIYHFQKLRLDIPLAYYDGRSSFFTETLAPIYLGLVDLLLQRATKETNQEQKQALLREARATVEQTKVSELQDYFRDPCIVAQTEEIEVLSPTTAVLYPIILPDRLELLVSIGRRLYQGSSAMDSEQLMDRIRDLSFRLRHRWSFRALAHSVYTWLIQPVTPLLEDHTVDTLVFVPDGPLRLLPIAALWDGERYLVERYAIATAPGLTLLDPKPLPRKRMRSLLAGLSQPGPVVGQLPDAMLASLVRSAPQQSEPPRRGIPLTVRDLHTRTSAALELGIHEERADKVAERLALPGVKQEINELAQLLTGEVLLDDQFRLNRFVSEVETQPYRVVHIASHGFFGGTAADSFILTYDDKLDMNALAGLLQPKQLAERPVELLALSACQTAEGNDRTPLGLSGVALKSGARSALGSLWPIYDQAAQRLLPTFYQQLSDPDVTKAQALQQAQLDLIRSEELAHPTYWAPFILVGNWL